MEFTERTIDDILHKVLSILSEQKCNLTVTKGSVVGELLGVVIRLTNPRARLSATETRGKPFSAIGELLWYLAKSNDLNFITHYIERYKEYSDDGTTIYGAYGPRLFNMDGKYNQVDNIVKRLKENPNSRKAVIQLFKADDIIKNHLDVPCTCSLQFILRDNKLNMIVYMRSNDVVWGLPHDIFAFTMLQEIIAGLLNAELGEYVHMVGNLHLYEEHLDSVKQYLKEGIQSSKLQMPIMPTDNIIESIDTLLNIEMLLRSSDDIDIDSQGLNSYWLDLAYMLKIHNLFKEEQFEEIKDCMPRVNKVYKPYIEKRLRNSRKETK